MTENLKRLHEQLEHSGKDLAVLDAVTALLRSPDDIDLQIDTIGCAHLENWLPNRKRVFWDAFDIRSEAWASRCVNRIVQRKGDKYAACALLKSDALFTLREVERHSPSFVMVWDVHGAEFCGIGLARHQKAELSSYFYVGWKPDETEATVARVDYIEHIELPLGSMEYRLNQIKGMCRIKNAFWAELPYRSGYEKSALRSFEVLEYYRQPYGVTKTMQQQLGLDWNAT